MNDIIPLIYDAIEGLNELNGLIGLTIGDYFISDDKSQITFRIDWDFHKPLFIQYEVSTCGGYSAWIDSAEGIKEILGNKIVNIIDHDNEDVGNNIPHGLIFNIELVTDKGCCIIDFRTDCNGHYGANLTLKEIIFSNKSLEINKNAI